MSGMTKADSIQQFIHASHTDFGALQPAKAVARCMSVIDGLRRDHALNWQSIADLFNQARVTLDLPPIPSATLCRLYHLECQRIALRQLQHKPGFTPAAVHPVAERLPSNSPAPWKPPAVVSPVDGGTVGRIRDGPSAVPAVALPSVQQSLALRQSMNDFPHKAKRQK